MLRNVSSSSCRSLLMAAASVAALSCACAGSANAACDAWNGGNGNWYGSGGWQSGDPNSGGTDVCIQVANSTVDLTGANASVGNLTIGATDTLNIGGSSFLFIDGTQISNAGQINLGYSGSYGVLQLQNNVALSGGGVIDLLSSGTGYIRGNGVTLTNVDNTIEGTGFIGDSGGLNLINEATIEANVLNATLNVNQANGGVTNSGGTLLATGGGTLQLYNGINNTGGAIQADTGSTVLFNGATVSGGKLKGAGTITNGSNVATLDNVTIASGTTYTSSALSSYTHIKDTITNNGAIDIGGNGAGYAVLQVDNNVNLTGGGTVDLLTSGTAYLRGNGVTLTNTNNLIEGAGFIGDSGGLALINDATIEANDSGLTLAVNQANGGVTNNDTLLATGGGILELYNGITNTGATIQSDTGSEVLLTNATINGGMLQGAGTITNGSNNSTLDNVTIASGTTYTSAGTSATTFLKDTITNKGTINIGGDGGTNYAILQMGNNVNLTGNGTVDMLTSGTAYLRGNGVTLTNTNNLIEGAGFIGDSGGLVLINDAKIEANVSGDILHVNQANGGVTNNGTLLATGGGILELYNGITNTGAVIQSDTGSEVLLTNATINGGTLQGGGTFDNGSNTAALDNVTIASGSTYTSSGTSATTFLDDTITNKGTIDINSSGSSNYAIVQMGNNVNLTGGGTVDLIEASNAAYLRGNGVTLTNTNNLIEGAGFIGDSGGLNLINDATIEANDSGLTLAMNAANGGVTNNGTLLATGGGILQLYNHITNTGAVIQSDTGSEVLLTNATITGGTLQGLGTFTNGSNQAVLDNVTIASGTTYTSAGTSAVTYLEDMITNKGTIDISGGGSNYAMVQLGNNVTLQGGGTVDLIEAPNAAYLRGNGVTLTNVDNLIEGEGNIGDSGGLTFVNEASGTLFSNVLGGIITLGFAGGPITNDGTFEVAAGSELHMANGAFTNFGSATLTGGTYEIYGTTANAGTMQINEFGNTGGEIVNNDATIYLNGVNSNLVDANGFDALSAFNNNEAGGSFTITNGRNFTSPGDFANTGIVNVGATSTFNTGLNGGNNYNQSAGTTTVDGRLQAANVNIGNSSNPSQNGGTLQGTGTVAANLFDYGTVRPGDAGSAGTLTVSGNFTMGAQGTLEIDIGGTNTGRYSQLDVLGHTTLAGTLAVVLLDSFHFAKGETFDIVNTDPFSGDFSHLSLDGVGCTSRGTDSWNCSNLSNGLYLTEEFLSNNSQLWLQVNGQVTHGVPEPDPLLPLGGAFGALAAAAWLRRKKAELG